MKVLSLLLALLLLSVGRATIIPLSEMPSGGWTGNVGVPGGIPTTYTMFVNLKTGALGAGGIYGGTLAAGDGVTDDAGAINAALLACPNGQYVLLPAGSYLCDSRIGHQGSGGFYTHSSVSIVLKGAGPGVTKILSNVPPGDDSLFFGADHNPVESYQITAGNTRGSTSITVGGGFVDPNPPHNAHPGLIVPGMWAIVQRSNTDSGFDATGSNGYMADSCSQIVKVATVVGNPDGTGSQTVTFTPQLNEGHPLDRLTTFVSPPVRCGVEELTIQRINQSSGNTIVFIAGQECWVKNVEAAWALNWHVQLRACAACEVRHCYIHDAWGNTSNQDYGTGMFQYSCNNLVEDNIYVRTRHAIMSEYGGQNNVFGYNYSKDEGDGSNYLMGDILTHGGNPRYELWEGNVAGTIKWDYVLGGMEYNTAFRNWIRRRSLPVVYVACFGSDIQRHNYSSHVVGNVYDIPPAAYFGNIRRWGSTGDDESDPDLLVQPSTIVHGELDLNTNTVTWDGTISDHNLPDSLYLSGRPSWWDGYRWPGIGGDLSSTAYRGNRALPDVGGNPAYRRALAAGY